MRANWLAAVVIGVGVVGCGPREEAFAPVEGRVTLAGGESPLPGSVAFRPDPANREHDEAPPGRGSSARTGGSA